jgi:hypothetical protein
MFTDALLESGNFRTVGVDHTQPLQMREGLPPAAQKFLGERFWLD